MFRLCELGGSYRLGTYLGRTDDCGTHSLLALCLMGCHLAASLDGAKNVSAALRDSIAIAKWAGRGKYHTGHAALQGLE
jgi:hypothetical protein